MQIKHIQLSFNTTKDLRGRAEILPAGPLWKCTLKQTLYPTKHPLKLFHQDPIECLQSLMNNPLLTNALRFKPLRVFKTLEKLMRVYSEWRTGDAAWNIQVSRLSF